MDDQTVKGRIFDIQRFSVHDGPGIRTIVFFKGCALRCQWCCNPESQESKVQIMHMDDGKSKEVGKDVTVAEVMETVRKDMPYYRRSGGGVTLSGGEALLQPEFAEALLRESVRSGINTAIESTAFTHFSVIERLLPFLDLYLLDIKHINNEKHKQFTAQPNLRILENAKKLDEYAKHLIIRVPVIPTFNATKEEIGEIAAFVSKLKNTNEIHLLPYHKFGTDKYRWLGRPYTLPDIEPPTDEEMQALKTVVEQYGLKCQIGG